MILQGIRDSTTTPFSDGIRGIASDGRTIEFKMCSPKSVESKASKALSKADIAVIITFTRKGLNKVNTNNIFGKGEVFILNTYTDNGVEFLTKNSPNHWRKSARIRSPSLDTITRSLI